MSWPKRKWFHRDPNPAVRTCIRCLHFEKDCKFKKEFVFPDDLGVTDCEEWKENPELEEFIDFHNCE